MLNFFWDHASVMTDTTQSKQLKKANEDIINCLPDEILCHIFSFLPTRNAVRTSILCKRWRYAWTGLPNLDFDDEGLLCGTERSKSNMKYKKKLFEKYVNRKLLRRSDPIKRFRLGVYTTHLSLNFKKKLISSAIMHHVEELCFADYTERSIQLPKILFSCGTLKILDLTCRLVLDSCRSVCLPRLKILHLRRIRTLNDDIIGKIISDSPVLEELSIDSDHKFCENTMCVRSSSLKSLVIRHSAFYHNVSNHYRLVLDAPNLELLELFNSIPPECNFGKLYSLIKATVDVSQGWLEAIWGVGSGEYGEQVFQMLRQISNVKNLNLSASTLLALSKASCYNFPCFLNLTQLEVGFHRTGWFMLLLSQILGYPQNLEVLLKDVNLHGRSTLKYYWDQFMDRVSEEAIFLDLSSVSQCLNSSIGGIQFTRFDATAIAENLKLIEYILENATVLKEVIITLHYASPEDELDYLKKSVRFPRASSRCRLLFPCKRD